MPKKRRKRIAADSSPDIPYPRVRVEWIDCVSDSGWATDKEFDKMKLAQPVNEGWYNFSGYLPYIKYVFKLYLIQIMKSFFRFSVCESSELKLTPYCPSGRLTPN